MKKKKKIFKPKRHYKIKKRNGSAVKIITGAAALAVLVFFGYSVAGPINRYLTRRSEETQSEAWSPSDTDAPFSEGTGGAQTETDMPPLAPAQTEGSAPEKNLAQTDGELTGAAAVQTEPAQITPAAPEPEIPDIRSGGAAYPLDARDMSDAASLGAALDELAASGCSAVIFPVKTAGGIFHYKTELSIVDTVEGDSPVTSDVTAAEMVKAARSRGLRPVALLSVLYDNNRYGDYRDGSYRSEDGDTWLDTSPEKGGKPWLSPFDDTAREYICDIVEELSTAGFKEIICDDFVFPEFRSTDIDILGEEVVPYGDRYLALTSLARMMTERGNETGCEVMLRVTANSVIRGYSELFYPEELSGCRIALDYSEDNISRTMVSGDNEIILDDMDIYRKITSVYAEVSARCGEMPRFPMLDKASMSADDFAEAVRAVTALGYDKYYVY